MDIKLIIKNDGSFTIGIENGKLQVDKGFETAIYLSLFSDAQAPSDKIQNIERRRGTPRDLVSIVSDRNHGSWLWLLNQAKLTPENRNYVKEYIEKSLSWFIEDGLASSINISVEIVPKTGFAATIIINLDSGKIYKHYLKLWEYTGV